jgi:hypothetical protein
MFSRLTTPRLSSVVASLGMALLGSTLEARAAQLEIVAPVKSCADIKALDLSRGEAGPARIDSAELVAEGSQQFCTVKGYVAPAVNFVVRLPTSSWTQRYLQLGCGGYCGGATLTSGSVDRQSSGCTAYEDKEMVVASSDLGHRRSGTFFPDGVWAVENPGAIVDFAYAGNHKTALAVKAIVRAFYGQAPKFSYFSGCSDGGRQGLEEAQRFPEDFDGIVAGSTTLDVVATNTVWHAWNARVNSGADNMPILTADKIPALARAVRDACAGPDGLIADARACRFDAHALVCKLGQSDASCLTAEQADVVTKIWDGPVDETGEHLFPGGLPRGSELAWIGSMVPAAVDAPLSLATSSDFQWSWDFPDFLSALGEITGVTNQNMKFTRAEFDRLNRLAGLFEPSDPDLSRFAARGGKLIMWHGWADSGSAPLGSLNYFDAVHHAMGNEAAGRTIALYLPPGVYHCSGGPTPARADYLSPLMAWREDGAAPGAVTLSIETSPTDAAVTKTVILQPHIAQPDADRTEWVGLAHYKPGQETWCAWKGAAMACEPKME